MQDLIADTIHSYLQEKGYDNFVPGEFVEELAERIIEAIGSKEKTKG